MSRLDSIRIAGYKSIRDQEIELRPLNLLIGANGSGKSNFLGAFRLLHEIINNRLQIFVRQSGGADRILHFGRKVTERLVLDLRFGIKGYLCKLLPTVADSLFFEEEEMIYDCSEFESLGTGYETAIWTDNNLRLGSTLAGHVTDAFRDWRVYHFQDTSPAARVKQTGDLHDNNFLRPDAGNLAAFLYLLQETRPEIFRNITEVVRMVAPFFGSFNLRPDPLNPEKIRLEWQESGSDTYFDAHSLSDGTLRFICLATLLLQPDLPDTVLLDEPELGLHPYAITLLADLLQSAAVRTQVVVSTQSVTLVNQFAPEDVIVVDRADGASVFRRLSEEAIASWLDDYSLGELWEKNVLGGRPSA